MICANMLYLAKRLRNIFSPPPQIIPPKRILVIAAHPDDAEAGCGATIAKLVRRGSEATFIVVTNGNKGDDAAKLSPTELTDKRGHEAVTSASCLGVNEVIMLGYNDGELFYTDALRAELVRYIRQFKPDAVFTHESLPYSRFDGEGINHADHRVVGQATMDAVYPFARGALQYPEQIADGMTPHTVRELFIWGSLTPNHYEDVSTTAQDKLIALASHGTQFGDGSQMSNWMKDCMKKAGRESGMSMAESFLRITFRA
jgi:LmbE family N-acetylglucosaminyl deacetylase